MSINLNSWYTEEESARRLGLAPRTFRRFVAAGTHKDFEYAPERKRRPREGKKPETVYNPNDVDTLAAVVNTKPRPAGSLPAPVPAPAPEPPHPLVQYLERMVLHDKLYLNLKEAVQVSGLPRSFLRQIAPEIGFKVGRSWRFPKSHLADSARLSQLAGRLMLEASKR